MGSEDTEKREDLGPRARLSLQVLAPLLRSGSAGFPFQSLGQLVELCEF
jgi:hypothetical protein